LFKRLSDFHPFPTVAAVGWIEQSETHHPAAGVVMGFGYHLYAGSIRKDLDMGQDYRGGWQKTRPGP
jgi:hypothetical protein